MDLLHSVDYCPMQSNESLFLQTKPFPLFLRASIPGAIGMVASSIYFTLELLLIGRLVGQTAFAAANLVMPFILINFALSDLIAVGSSVRIAIKLGEGKKDEADNLFTVAVLSCMLINVLIGGLLILLCPTFLSLMGADAVLTESAMDYFTVYALFSPFTGLVFAVDNYLRICGRIRFSMGINIFMSLLCLSLQILFLWVLDLGVAFAALGSSLGMTITAVICLLQFLRKDMALSFARPHFSFPIIWDMFRQGLPTFLNNVSGRITNILMNSLLLRWGGDLAVSVYGVLMSVDGIVVPCMYGVFDSLQPAIGYNWGAERKDRVKRIALCCVIATVVICLFSVVLIELFPAQIFSLFLKVDETGLAMAVHALSIMGLTYIVRWISYSAQSFSSATGHNREATVLSLCHALIFPLLMMAVLQQFELEGIWFVIPSAAFCTAAVAFIIYLVRIRKSLRLD